jgi:hypothetical protein
MLKENAAPEWIQRVSALKCVSGGRCTTNRKLPFDSALHLGKHMLHCPAAWEFIKPELLQG